ncbi:MAG: hypothetical protein ABI885_18990 [Gammaproteobacteria bacterium]
MPDEVLTIKEAAALLKLAEKTVYTKAPPPRRQADGRKRTNTPAR